MPRERALCKIYNVGVNPTNVAITFGDKFGYVTNSNGYSIPGSDSVSVLNLRTGVPETMITDSSFNGPYRVAIDHRNKYAYVTNSSSPSEVGLPGTVSVIDINTNKVTNIINGFDGPTGIVLSRKLGYVTNYGSSELNNGNGKTVTVFRLKTREIVTTIPVAAGPVALALDCKHHLLYCVSYNGGTKGSGVLTVISTRNHQVVQTLSGFSGPFDVGLSKCGKIAYVTNFFSNNFAPYGTTVSVVGLNNLVIIKNIFTGIQPSGIAVGKEFVYVSNYNALYSKPGFKDLVYGEGTISVIRIEGNEVIDTIPVGQSPSTITLSHDRSKLYVCNYSQNVVRTICLRDTCHDYDNEGCLACRPACC